MGYRGKVEQQEQARLLRAQNRTLADIAAELDVSKSSVSLWVRDVPFTASKRRYGPRRRPHPQQAAKILEIEKCAAEGRTRFEALSEDAFFAAGVALYAGEGSKTDGSVSFANCDPDMIRFFAAWLRRFFDVDEPRLRVQVYLHQGLDLDAAHHFWSSVTGVPLGQFRKGHRAVADPTIRHNKHENGCCYLRYHCSHTHRKVMGLVRALLSSDAIPG